MTNKQLQMLDDAAKQTAQAEIIAYHRSIPVEVSERLIRHLVDARWMIQAAIRCATDARPVDLHDCPCCRQMPEPDRARPDCDCDSDHHGHSGTPDV